MRVKSVILIFLLLFFCSCGRKHPGVIINDTDETLLVTLKLNQYSPDNYLYDDIILNYKSQPGDAKSIGDYVIRFDSISNIAVLKFSPSDKIYIGTVRAGGNGRNDYHGWEFKEISCKGDKGFKMHVKDATLMDYVHRNILSNYTHSLEIE